MSFFSRKSVSPKDTSIPRLPSDVSLDRNIDTLRNAHKEFTKLLDDFISGVQEGNKREKQ